MPPQQNTPTPPSNIPPMSPPAPAPAAMSPAPRSRKKWLRTVLGGIAFLVIAFIALNVLTNKTEPSTPTDETQTTVEPPTLVSREAKFLISAMIPPPKGFDMLMTQDLLTKNGADVFIFSVNWDVLEPSPRKYALNEHIAAPFNVIAPKYPFEASVLIFKMIDSNVRTMPSDLKSKSFDDPEVEERFLAALHAIATTPGVAEHVK